jgi:hypothetical protein
MTSSGTGQFATGVPGVHGVEFWLVERNANMIYTVLEPVSQLRLLLARAASRRAERPAAGITWAPGSRSLRRQPTEG